jgi:3-deoxy-D-manno-octulosonate 8-phosphate phosphatase KdsC-like HAD superfamily phosphatase
VLTDGGLSYSEDGDELNRLDVRDAQGLVLQREAGLLTVIVTRKQTTIAGHGAIREICNLILAAHRCRQDYPMFPP